MKKLFVLLVLISNFVFSQKFILTPQNLVNAEDNTKNYVILEFPEKKQAELFKSAKLYFNTLYNNPKYVSSEVENEQIALNAVSKSVIKLKGMLKFDVSYNSIISFKDGKVKVELSIKKFERYTPVTTYGGGYEDQGIIGFDIGLSKTGIFNSKGKLINEKGKETTEEFANNFVNNLKEAIIKNNSGSDW